MPYVNGNLLSPLWPCTIVPYPDQNLASIHVVRKCRIVAMILTAVESKVGAISTRARRISSPAVVGPFLVDEGGGAVRR